MRGDPDWPFCMPGSRARSLSSDSVLFLAMAHGWLGPTPAAPVATANGSQSTGMAQNPSQERIEDTSDDELRKLPLPTNDPPMHRPPPKGSVALELPPSAPAAPKTHEWPKARTPDDLTLDNWLHEGELELRKAKRRRRYPILTAFEEQYPNFGQSPAKGFTGHV